MSHMKKKWQYITTADTANPLVMNIYITIFTVIFLAIVIYSLTKLSPNQQSTYYFRLIVDTYVPSIFTLCVSIIVQTFVEATQQKNTRFMLNLIAMAGAFFYILVYVFVPQNPSIWCLIGMFVGSFLLLLLSLYAMKQVLIFENTDVYRIAAKRTE